MRRLLGRPRRAPLAVALLLAAPLFFAALLASSLAVEHPHVLHEWTNRSFWRKASETHPARPGRVFHQVVLSDPTSGNEAKIWLYALVVVLILIAIGTAAAFLRRGGAYVSCAAAIVLTLALHLRLDQWVRHHTARFPYGIDNVPDGSPSNQLGRGEWEGNAHDTITSLSWFTIGLAVAVAVVYAVSHWRRVRALAHQLPDVSADERLRALGSKVR